MIVFESINRLNKFYLYRLIDISKRGILVYAGFMILFFAFGINVKVALAIMSPVLIILLIVSMYRSVYYIHKIVLEEENIYISYFKFSKENELIVNLNNLKIIKLRDKLTYHKHYKMIFSFNNNELKQYPVLDWTYGKMDEVFKNINKLN